MTSRPLWILAVLCLVAGFTTPVDNALTWTVTPAPGRSPLGDLSGTAITELGTHEFGAPVDTISAGSAVDVRGLDADGRWSEWLEADPATLPESTRVVQARLVRTATSTGAGPITLTATNLPGPRAAVPAAGATFKVFATREGLVGKTTANGHVITARDHFVALPSRRGLSTSGNGDYTVRICTLAGDRCEWAPVWDVGPWNTKDDYWNAPRQTWPDLAQGLPESQAAYASGYNGGKDQSGRKVTNPAGIDLADGAFWDGLELTGNAYVTVTYQWSGTGAWGTVAAAPLTVRSGPDDSARDSGIAAPKSQVRVECAMTGEPVDGPSGLTDVWYRLAAGKYLSSAELQVTTAPASC
jgi:hypothetical protein